MPACPQCVPEARAGLQQCKHALFDPSEVRRHLQRWHHRSSQGGDVALVDEASVAALSAHDNAKAFDLGLK